MKTKTKTGSKFLVCAEGTEWRIVADGYQDRAEKLEFFRGMKRVACFKVWSWWVRLES